MLERNVDVAIIGGGTAGMTAYQEAKRYTPNVVVIEGGPFGTTCARVGCMPSKLLIASADAARAVKQAPRLGVHPEGLKINGQEVMQRVKSERDRFVGFVLDSVDAYPKEDKILGAARFLDVNTLMVDEHTKVHAKAVVIATGSAPFVPPIIRDLGSRLVLNDDVFEWDDLPESVAVFGAGVIGLEIGQALHDLGVRIHLFSIGGLIGALSDPEIKASVEQHFSSEFGFQTEARVQSVERIEDRVRITYLNHQDEAVSDDFDYVLAATGRRPNLGNLGLDKLGLELDRLGLPLYDEQTLQICRLPVFLAGDVNNDRPLLHEAADEGKIAGFNAAHFPQTRPGERRSPMSVVFTHPQIAMVGKTFASLPAKCTAVGSASFESQGRSRVMLENIGKLRVYADYATGRFLGAELFGPRAEHLAHLLAWAHQQRMTIDQMLQMPFYHPVIEEGLRTALRHVAKEIKKGPPDECPCLSADPADLSA